MNIKCIERQFFTIAGDALCIAKAMLVVLWLLASCGHVVEEQPDGLSGNISFRDIAGVTQDEIAAIESLRNRYDSFVYGVPLCTEAFEDKQGNVKGFAVLFCNWMTELFGIPFRAKIMKDYELIDEFYDGKVDFTGHVNVHRKRGELYYMTSPIAERMLTVYRIIGSTPLLEIAKSRPLRYAIIPAITNVDVENLKNDNTELIFLDSIHDVYNMLADKTIDAFLANNSVEGYLRQYSDIIEKPYLPVVYSPIFLATQKEELKAIISVIDKALNNEAITQFNIMYEDGYQEYRKYYISNMFSAEEREYMKTHSVIPIVARSDNYPIEFYNQHEKKWQGIIFDLLEEVTALTGMEFQVVNHEKALINEVIDMLETGEGALIGELVWSKERENRFLWAYAPTFTDNYAFISRMDYPEVNINSIFNAKIGLLSNSTYARLFHDWFPGHSNTVEYDDFSPLFDALERGEVDLVMLNQTKLLIMLHYSDRLGFKNNFILNRAHESIVAFNLNEPALCSIFDKILSITDTKIISERWLQKNFDYQTKVLRAQQKWLIISVVLLLCLLVLMIIFFLRSRQLRKRLNKFVVRQTEELSVKNSMLTAIFNSIPDIIFIKDNNFRFSECNKRFEQCLGVTKEEIVGKNDMEALKIPAEIAEMFMEYDKNLIHGELDTITKEEIIPYVDGSNKLHETIKTRLIVNDVPFGILGISRDISQRKAAEEAAHTASRAKSAFIASMSHEIRTPMSSIIGFTELALDDELSDKTRDYLQKILCNSELLLQIINDILDISKIEVGKMELERIPFDLDKIFDQCITTFMPKASEKGLILHCYAEPFDNDKRLLGDPTRIRQIFNNFLSNAVKFTNSGSVRLMSSLKSLSYNTVTLYFEIRDTGIGMNASQISKIYEPYVQADVSTARQFGGTGLGLSICKNMIEMMGGDLKVESSLGQGSKFTFELTFDTINASEAAAFDKNTERIEKPTFEGEVLLCEDNRLNQQIMCENLAKVGLKTTVADNGLKGVELVKERIAQGAKPFDLIFMDTFMPIMDGLEAASIVSKLCTGTPIVAITANIMKNDTEIYKTNGMDDYLGKPFTTQDFWHCLLKFLQPVGFVPEERQTDENEDPFKELRVEFANTNRTTCSQIRAAIASGDIELARSLAHTLKGTAGMLKETRIYETAAAVEAILKEGKNLPTEEQINTLEKEITALC